MKIVSDYFRNATRELVSGWNQFWFTPADPASLCLIRILAGSMLLYTHLVWTIDLEGFFGPDGRLPVHFREMFYGSPFAWTHLAWLESVTLLWIVHLLALLVLLLFTLGCWTRITGILSYLIVVSYANRATGALFGLDQINGLLALYLALGPSGACYSVDRWWKRKVSTEPASEPQQLVSANLSIRLIQLHMCVIYLFAGLGKLQGETWWNGEAMWGAMANYEYQSMDFTWLAGYPLIVNFLTHLTIFWEVSYACLVWPRWTRPLVICMAVVLHLGIASAMGMITFGLIMIIANVSFVSPQLIRSVLDGAAKRLRSKGQGP